MECLKKYVALFTCIAIVSGLTATGLGYARGRKTISSPGSLSKTGSSSASHSFRTSSAGMGVGALSTSSSGYTGNVLKSSIKRSGFAYQAGKSTFSGASPLKSSVGSAYKASSFKKSFGNTTIGSRSSQNTITASAISPSKSNKYTSSDIYATPLVSDTYQNKTASILREGVRDISTAESYLLALGADKDVKKYNRDETISSFAVKTPEGVEYPFNEHIKSGELLFKEEEFVQAFSEFEFAKDMDSTSPEAWVSMAHARFANSVFDYPSVSYYLQRAFVNFPELPLVNIRPKNFYGLTDTYVRDVLRLREHIETNDYDANSHFINAYYSWFKDEPDIELVKKSLQNAIDQSPNEQLTEAISIFWDGIVAAGKASGKLTPVPKITKNTIE